MLIKKLFATFLLIGFFSCKTERKSNPISVSKTDSLKTQTEDSKILSYVVNPKIQNLEFFWKNKNDSIIKTFENLKTELKKENKSLVFAMNGGMFNKQFSPQGLYVEKSKMLSKLDTIKKGYGNFYLQPNGVFSISKNSLPNISTTNDFKINSNINYATQSGPMLLIDGEIHPKFSNHSSNLNIRNGVGILPNGNVLFAMSKTKISFYDFATYFKQRGCKNALYLDGFVSKTYLPSKNQEQLGGDFGVIIAESLSMN